MGAGDYLAGDGLAGFDPAMVPAPPPTHVAGRVALYDPATRDFRRLADGTIATVHPVDQAAALAAGVAAGSIASATSIGNELGAIPFLGTDFVARATDAVRRAFAALVARGDVALLAIDAEQPGETASATFITYRNLRLIGAPPQTLIA